MSRAKSKAQRISAVNNLKQIGLAARTWAIDNGDALPPSFEAMKNELSTDKITYDPNTGQRFVYVGAGKSAANPEAIIAYSPSDVNGRAVAFADGSVQAMSAEKFQEALQRDAALPRVADCGERNAPAAQPSSDRRRTAAARQPPSRRRRSAAGLHAVGNRAAALTPRAGGDAGRRRHGAVARRCRCAREPTATGVRPIRIEVPRTGQSFSFTKVLNAGQEPLTASFSMMRLKVYRGVQMVMQVCAFVLGLLMLWWLSLRRGAQQPVGDRRASC